MNDFHAFLCTEEKKMDKNKFCLPTDPKNIEIFLKTRHFFGLNMMNLCNTSLQTILTFIYF